MKVSWSDEQVNPDKLILYFDGLCEPTNPGGWACWAFAVMVGIDLVHTDRGVAAKQGSKLATNNFAEYTALGKGLAWLKDQGWSGELSVFGDSKLVVCQVNGDWKCNKPHLIKLRDRCQQLISDLGDVTLTWVPREQNELADRLTSMAYREAVQNAKRS